MIIPIALARSWAFQPDRLGLNPGLTIYWLIWGKFLKFSELHVSELINTDSTPEEEKAEKTVSRPSLSTGYCGSWGENRRGSSNRLSVSWKWESRPGVPVKVETKQNNCLFFLERAAASWKGPAAFHKLRSLSQTSWWKESSLTHHGRTLCSQENPWVSTSLLCDQVQTQSQHWVSLQIVY